MTAPALPILHVKNAFAARLPPRDYVLPALPLGKVGVLSAAGGTGKSFWALQAAFQVCAGGFCSFDLSGAEMNESTMMGGVLYVSLEDEVEDITRRLQSIRAHYSNDPDIERGAWIDDIADADMIRILALAGTGAVLLDADCAPTLVGKRIKDESAKVEGCRLIIVDTLRRAHDADENNSAAMSRILRFFEALARDTNTAILLLHHENKAGISNADAGASAVRGSSSIVDNARWISRMTCMSKDEASVFGIPEDDRKKYLKIMNEKTNYGPIQPTKWLVRCDGGVLRRVQIESKSVKWK